MSGQLVQRLGLVLSVGGSVWCSAWAVSAVRGSQVARRGRHLLHGAARRPLRPRLRVLRVPLGSSAVREWSAPVAVGLAAAFAVGGVAGGLVGLGAAYAVRRRLRRARARPDPRGQGQLSLAAELLAACLAAGAAPSEAADAVGGALGGPLGEALVSTAAELRLGGDPADCWARLGAFPGAGALGRWMELAATSGVPPVAAVSRLAAEYRAARSRAAVGRARRAAVLATAPLGLCFLPAFLAVGLVPVLIGLVAGLARAR